MATSNVLNYRKEVVEAAEHLVRSGIMTKSLHGNLSLRIPGEDAFLLTAGASLANLKPESIAMFRLDGTLIEGTVVPLGAEIIHMHGIVYRERPEFHGVVHSHSPFATGFAVAGLAVPPAYEAMVRNGMTDGIPVAKYGPRGSDESVNNIRDVLRAHEGIKAMLLENHGVLAFGDSVAAAVRANMTCEESAEITLYAQQLGGAKPIPGSKIADSRARAESFAAAGTYSSDAPKT